MPLSQLCSYGQRSLIRNFRTAVCLHGHTLHSKENLATVGRIVDSLPLLPGLIRRARRRSAGPDADPVDFARAWWTPPLSARQALALEQQQIESRLGMPALVSLSDHDTMDGCIQLRLLKETREAPLSVEWSVPFGATYFHLGVHNLPAGKAAPTMREMDAYHAAPQTDRLHDLLADIIQSPETLVVFNHPWWDQPGIGVAAHAALVGEFFGACGRYLHAIEINGLRSWMENREAIRLARAVGLPLISGGDRHGREPSAALNLTNAATFAEFADEVRRGKTSIVLLMPQYEQPLNLRIIHNMSDILRDAPDHSRGWVRWSDRIFYQEHDRARPLSELWEREPAVIRHFLRAVRILSSRRLQPALRFATAGRRHGTQEAAS